MPTSPDITCAHCQHVLAPADARIEVAGSHRHDVTSDAGYRFTIRCFASAPGAIAAGEAVHEGSWFPGYTWQRAFCRACSRHVGWLYRHKTGTFFGLIASSDAPLASIRDSDVADR